MATISNAKNGTRRIQFAEPNGKRRTLYLGKIPKRSAEKIRFHIEELLGAKIGKVTPQPDTVEWLSKCGDVLHAKFLRAGLALPRES